MYKLIKQVIESNELNPHKVLDVCFALCMADHFVGMNRLELSVDKFLGTVSDGDEDWDKVLQLLEVGARGAGGSLPKVQRYRVITDALVICCGKEVAKLPDVALTSEASSRVARLLGIEINSHEYSDIDSVKSVLEAICRETSSLDFVVDLEKKVEGYEKDFDGTEFDLDKVVRNAWKDIQLNGKYKYIKSGSCIMESTDEIQNFLEDKLMYALEYEVLLAVKKTYKENRVATGVILLRFAEDNSCTFGVCSFSNHVPALDYVHGFERSVQQMLSGLFSKSMNYDIQDLDKVMLLIKMLYSWEDYV